MGHDESEGLAAALARVQTVADLAGVLQELRRREAAGRPGPDPLSGGSLPATELSYRQIAERTGWSPGSVFAYLNGLTLAPAERLSELVRMFGGRGDEQVAVETARARLAGARREGRRRYPRADQPVSLPRSLPAPVRSFVGRAADLTRLDALLGQSPAPGKALVCAVAGMGGVGKTALAVNWAHRVAERFPDGQLYVNLRGYDRAEPLSIMDALGVLLAGLGVPPSAMPGALAPRMSLYHRLLAGRTTLVLLDNALNVEQVRPLLPPPHCLTVVTSRDNLTELVASHGAQLVTLEVLPEPDALELLRRLIGERVDTEPDAARALARRCGHLPLALRVAAEHSAFRPGVALADLVAEFSPHSSAQPDALEIGGERADVRSVLTWSLRQLPAPQARAFCLLGLVPGVDIDAYGLAALMGVAEVAPARDLAQALVHARLLQPEDAGRYSMHDMVRAYAREVVQRIVPPAERQGAMSRLLDYYVVAAAAAVRAAGQEPQLSRKPHWGVTWSGAVADLDEPQLASAWLAAERINLVRTCVHAAREGWGRQAVALAMELRAFLDNGHDQDALTVYAAALAAAEGLGDVGDSRDLARLALSLSSVHLRAGELDACRSLAERALAACAHVDDTPGAIGSLINLGAVHDGQGHVDEAHNCFLRALDLARSAGLPAQEGRTLLSLGTLHRRRERNQSAADYFHRAAAAFAEAGDPLSAAEARRAAASVLAELGRFEEAAFLAEEALTTHLDHGGRLQQGISMATYGGILLRMGRHAEAVEVLSGAVTLGRDTHSVTVTVRALNLLGQAQRLIRRHRRG